jgi:hypothetical protein
LLFSINTSNDHYIDFEDIIPDNLILFNHFASILVSDIKLNNSLDYFYYDRMNEGGNILKYNGRLNYILEN